MYLLLTFIVQNFHLNLRVYPDWYIFPKLEFLRKTNNNTFMYILTPFSLQNF